MNVFSEFRAEIVKQLEDLTNAGRLLSGLDLTRVGVEPPRSAEHGDIATNAAMVLAKPAGLKPRDLAESLAERLRQRPQVVSATVAGPGFINVKLVDEVWRGCLLDILRAGPSYGDSELGRGQPVNVEYVSANPTGPMHVGHARGAVFGDALASLMAKAGFAVTREFYINDAGAQVDVLARSAYLRYREALGEAIGPIPDGLYPGDYLKETGQALAARDGNKWLGCNDEAWLEPVRDFAVAHMMAMIREDLAALGIRHDVFSSERVLVAGGAVEAILKLLEEKGCLYTGILDPPKGKTPDDWEPRPQTLFRSTAFGDDVDRPIRKSDGSWTYFAADIAYHYDKFRRGFAEMIDVLGADHGGYVKRMQAAVKAISDGTAALDVKMCQLVNLTDKGEPVKMSKRAGMFLTVRDVVERVGKDVVRFIMLTRRNDQSLDFDYAKVTEQSRDNPVFYVQYAHARARSVMRLAAESLPNRDLGPQALAQANLARLTDSGELGLVKMLANWPRIVEGAAEAHEPHRLAFYLQDLAAEFHQLWNKGKDDAALRFIVAGDTDLTLARLALVQAVAYVVASGLAVFGVEPVEEMRG
ncbi:MAG: arginine--tRNA ligase [Proteobacteria bacterium]|nr:arginine--tRNA ligase [Pseudomonadota bacterium]MBI3496004.1 arginine--tRNA ligase [Pseudomonadota bacterium]